MIVSVSAYLLVFLKVIIIMYLNSYLKYLVLNVGKRWE
ncbi:MAG: hypothetical protein BAJALOKI1v1_1700003 [Promethearchaeota archaeon]|nr:MAG: hypothetical protein BAJALOKI1v1_1700003 [Candidatus Lokiarchaeota archaeon]